MTAPIWHTEDCCKSCLHPLEPAQTLNSRGQCVYCGYTTSSGWPMCDTIGRTYRLEPTGKWWQFWRKPRKVYYTWNHDKGCMEKVWPMFKADFRQATLPEDSRKATTVIFRRK